jgi:Zn-dependent protease
MIFSLRELIDIIAMTLILGFIFKDLFKRTNIGVQKGAFVFACLVTAPAIILHELGHKFVALFFGLQATFTAAYTWLGIGVLLKLLGTGLIFFVPAYVRISGTNGILPLDYSVIAFAGPAVNLILFGVSWLVLRKKKLKKQNYLFWYITKQINLFLFIFNMLPIPMFDGFKVYQGIWQTIF